MMKKRQTIKIGDTIEFTNTQTNEIIKCLVTNLYRYSSFTELYKNHNKFSIGYLNNENANPDNMFAYYSKANIDKYGVLGIEIKLI